MKRRAKMCPSSRSQNSSISTAGRWLIRRSIGRFLALRLVKLGPGNFHWPFQLPDVPTWARGLGAGDTLEESDRLLTEARDHILAALADGRAEAVREGIRVIMQWGGVWTGLGHGHGNAGTVMAIPGQQLLADLRADLEHMANSKPACVAHMNAG